MPRLFISRKNFFEPSTCSASVGFGKRSKIFAERVAVAGHHAGRTVVAVAFQLAAGGHVGVVADVQRLHRLRRQQQPVVEMLDVDGIVGRGIGHLARRRPAFLGELLFGPAAGHHDPGAGLLGLGGLADFLQRRFQGRYADPVHFAAEGERGADAVNVAVGEAGNDGAAAEVDQACPVAGESRHRHRGARGQHLAVADHQRLGNRKIRIDGEDLAVEHHGIGALGRGHVRGQREDEAGERRQRCAARRSPDECLFS
jgi:hypothetical protein